MSALDAEAAKFLASSRGTFNIAFIIDPATATIRELLLRPPRKYDGKRAEISVIRKIDA